MKRNFFLIIAVLAGVLLLVNSIRRIMDLRDNSRQVQEAKQRLDVLRKENEELKNELSYKQSDEFAEAEIRNKLGLARENEAIVIIGEKSDRQQEISDKKERENWEKWRDLFFGS